MQAVLCRVCKTFHGWIEHPSVQMVEWEQRWTHEHYWRCPRCNTEHGDGAFMSERNSQWEWVTFEQIEEHIRHELDELLWEHGFFRRRS